MKLLRISSRILSASMKVDSVRSFKNKLLETIKSDLIGKIDVNKWMKDNFWLTDLFRGTTDEGSLLELSRIQNDVESLLDAAKKSYIGLTGDKSWATESNRLFARRIDAIVDDVEELVHKFTAPQRGPKAADDLINRFFTTPIDQIDRYGITRFVDRFWWPNRGSELALAVTHSRRDIHKAVERVKETLDDVSTKLMVSSVLDEERKEQLADRIRSLAEDIRTVNVDTFVLDHASFILDDIAKSVIPALNGLLQEVEDLGSYSSHYFQRYFYARLMAVESLIDKIRRNFADLVMDAKKLQEIAKSEASSHPTYASRNK